MSLNPDAVPPDEVKRPCDWHVDARRANRDHELNFMVQVLRLEWLRHRGARIHYGIGPFGKEKWWLAHRFLKLSRREPIRWLTGSRSEGCSKSYLLQQIPMRTL